MSTGTFSKKTTFESSDFFQTVQVFERRFNVLGKKTFRQGYQNWKLQSSSQKINQKIKLLKVLFFFQILQKFEWTFNVLGEKIFGRDIKIEKCSFRLIRSTKKSNYWKFSFFYQTFQNFERTFTVLGEKVLGRDIKIENCTLCLQSIMLGMKFFFRKFCKFSFSSDLEHNCFGFEATEFSPSLSKIQSTCLYEFSLRCWY